MQTKTQSPRPAYNTKTPLFLKALNWLAERDRRYREAQKLRRMPDERLADMGMTRDDAQNAHRPAAKPAASRQPIGALRRT